MWDDTPIDLVRVLPNTNPCPVKYNLLNHALHLAINREDQVFKVP